jgi:hypothetical protein
MVQQQAKSHVIRAIDAQLVATLNRDAFLVLIKTKHNNQNAKYALLENIVMRTMELQ